MTTTVNYSWTLPTVGASVNAWGTLVNNILNDIDAKMFARTGGAISGNVSVNASGMTTAMQVGQYAGSTTYGTVNFNGGTTFANTSGIIGGGALGNMYAMVPSGASHQALVNGASITTVSSTGLVVTGIVTPEADNTRTLGTGALRWSTVYAGTGTINTSDAREKTKVRTLADAEIEAAKDHSKEVGIYQFLESVKTKGDKARLHIGMTVQRSIEIMEKHGLDPMAYGFICYDAWEDEFVDHPKIQAVEAKDAVLDDEGNEIEPAVEAVDGKDAWTEQTQTAGDRYAFRYDQLNLFIARGIEARLTALEARA